MSRSPGTETRPAEDAGGARVVRGGVIHGVSVVASGLLQLVTLAVISRLLSPSMLGVVGAAQVFVGMSSLLGQAGFGTAIVQRRRLESEAIGSALALAVASGALLSLVAFGVSGQVGRYFESSDVAAVVRILSLSFLPASVAAIGEALLQRNFKYTQSAFSQVVPYAMGNLLLGCALALAGFGAASVAWGVVAQHSLRAALTLFAVRNQISLRLSWSSVRGLLEFGGAFTMTRVINYAALQADNVIVGRVLGLDALGTYSRAYQLVQMPGTYIGQALDRVIFPAMSVIQDERERLGRAALHSVALATIIVAPISAALVVFSPLVVVFVLGSQWAASAPVMQVLAIGMTFRMTYKVFDNVAKALGVLRQRVRRESAYLFFVVTFAAFGAQYGVLGVALGVVGAMAINAILAVADLARSIGLTGRMVLAAAAPGLLLSLVGMMLGVSLLSIFGRGPLSAAFAALSLSAFFFGSTALLAVGAGRFPSAAGAALNYVTRRSRG